MDRFEEMQYQIATEVSAGLIAGGVIAGLIGTAVRCESENFQQNQ